MENKIILVGKIVTDNTEEIPEGFTQVEFEVEDLLNKIQSSDIITFAKDNYDLVDTDDLSEAHEYDLVQELNYRGYKCLDEYDKEYHSCVKISSLDIQDVHMLKEITDKFINASIFEREDMYKIIMKFGH